MAAWAGLSALAVWLLPRAAFCGEAPKWMHALAAAPLPAHDANAPAILLYSETALAVGPRDGKLRRTERRVYKILRPEGEARGKVTLVMNGQTEVIGLRAWCIPASGKDYEVGKHDAVEAAWSDVPNGLLASDTRGMFLQIPAAVPGSVVGYESLEEQAPYVLADTWTFQDTIPVRETHYNLTLPEGWSYKAAWVNHADTTPVSAGKDRWQWQLGDVVSARVEPHMSSLGGVLGKMFITLIPPSGRGQALQSWNDFGAWYTNLAQNSTSRSVTSIPSRSPCRRAMSWTSYRLPLMRTRALPRTTARPTWSEGLFGMCGSSRSRSSAYLRAGRMNSRRCIV